MSVIVPVPSTRDTAPALGLARARRKSSDAGRAIAAVFRPMLPLLALLALPALLSCDRTTTELHGPGSGGAAGAIAPDSSGGAGSPGAGMGGGAGREGAGAGGEGAGGDLGGGSSGAIGGVGGESGRGTGAAGSGGTCVSSVVPLPPTGCPDVPRAPLGESSHPNEGANHLVTCSTTCYGTTPPSSGNHYPTWPVYKAYDQPVPWGFLVHGLEHGSIIVVYNCPCDCPDEVAAAKAWIAALPADENCSGAPPPRVVLAPDPTLDVRWAASAWGWTLRAAAFDPAAFQTFFSAHYDRGGESICGGLTDGSVAGWCN